MIDIHQHTAFTEGTPDVPRWMRGDEEVDFAVFSTILRPKTLDEMTPDELHESVLRQVCDLDAAVDRSRAVRTALGDED